MSSFSLKVANFIVPFTWARQGFEDHGFIMQ